MSTEDVLKYNLVDCKHVKKHTSLFKVTPEVARIWEQTNDTILGTITYTLDLLSNKNSYRLDLPGNAGAEDDEDERNKYLVMKADNFPCPMYVFSDSNDGKLAVNGIVVSKYDTVPLVYPDQTKYLHNKRELEPRVKVSNVTDMNKPVLLNLGMKRTNEAQKTQTKRIRMAPEELQNKLFELFENKPKYTIKELDTLTNQPVDYLRKSLDEICDKKKEKTATYYVLKPEYGGGDEMEE